MVDLVQRIAAPGKTCLVYVPGVEDIASVHQGLRTQPPDCPLVIQSLHPRLPPAAQDDTLRRPPEGCCKVVLTTGDATSGVTFADLHYVIDVGLAQRVRPDRLPGQPSPACHWISQAAAAQRADRAGRTRPGTALRLYPQRVHDTLMPAYDQAEMADGNTDRVLIACHLFLWEFGPSDQLLKLTLSPPSTMCILKSTAKLANKGLLDCCCCCCCCSCIGVCCCC